ncbi:MAG: DUF805 domain-containing protein [Novosphingobium sp.]|nr:DUF805 domain-containing protein [Novosphingobium sp.]
MLEWMLLPYKRYAEFSGRSRRKEYWSFALFQFLISIVLTGVLFAGGFSVDAGTGQPSFGPVFYLGVVLLVVFALGSFIPAIAVLVRRLHDQDKSGWFALLYFIPYVGPIVILVFMFLDGTKGPNRFGPDPKDPASIEVFS